MGDGSNRCRFILRHLLHVRIANTVVRNGEFLGADPDPTIRMDLLRQGDQLNTNGN